MIEAGDIPEGKVVFTKIQEYGYFDDFRKSNSGAATSILFNPKFTPADINRYKNILLFLKITSGSWSYSFFKDNKPLREKFMLAFMQDRSGAIFTFLEIENLILRELNLYNIK